MEIGIVSAQIRWEKSLLSQLDWAARNGFKAVELSCWSKQHEVIGLWAHRWDADAGFLSVLRKELTAFERVDIHASYNTGYDPVYITYHPLCREIYLDEIRWAIETAAAVGARVVTCHSGWLVHGKSDAERTRSLVEAMVELDALAEQYDNIMIGMETLEYFLPLERCSVLKSLALSNVKLTLDIGHMHRVSPPAMPVHHFSGPAYAAFEHPEKFIRGFAHDICHVHIHDCSGDESHLPLGAGIVDFPLMIQTLRDVGYAGALSLEIEGTPRDSILAKQYLAKLVRQGQ